MFFPEKPTELLVPSDAEYPDCVSYSFRPTLAQLRRCVAKLSPHKVPGKDGIPNVVLKESLELIAKYLLHIFKAVFMLGTYSDRWRVWDTIILCKPGKPRYDIPKAYRPIRS